MSWILKGGLEHRDEGRKVFTCENEERGMGRVRMRGHSGGIRSHGSCLPLKINSILAFCSVLTWGCPDILLLS